jgi:hypothetical protein
MVRANCALSLCARRVCLRLANLSNNDTPVPDALYDVEQNGLLFFLISALANALDRGGRQVAQHSPEPQEVVCWYLSAALGSRGRCPAYLQRAPLAFDLVGILDFCEEASVDAGASLIVGSQEVGPLNLEWQIRHMAFA